MPCLSVAGCWIAVCQCIILWIGMWWNSLSGVYKQCFALDNISYVLDWLQSQPISTVSTSLAEHCIHGCFPDVPGLAMAPWFSSSCCSKEPFGIVCRKSTYLLLLSLTPVFFTGWMSFMPPNQQHQSTGPQPLLIRWFLKEGDVLYTSSPTLVHSTSLISAVIIIQMLSHWVIATVLHVEQTVASWSVSEAGILLWMSVWWKPWPTLTRLGRTWCCGGWAGWEKRWCQADG